MRLSIVAVGRLKGGPEKTLVDDYLKRLTWPVAVSEVAEDRVRDPAERPRRECARLLAAVPAGARIVALDSTGRALSSEALAKRLGAWRDDGVGEVAFLIGGADGLTDEVRDKAALVLSLGPMTWPHLLARAMLAEQLYRAQSILAGHPYHRGNTG